MHHFDRYGGEHPRVDTPWAVPLGNLVRTVAIQARAYLRSRPKR
jgi:hypothetical protein